MSGEQYYAMLTKKPTAGIPGKKIDPKEIFANLSDIEPSVADDYLWGRKFGFIQKSGMVWKYGNPWRYPAHEFAQLKTLVTADLNAEIANLEDKKSEMPAMPAAQKTAQTNREKEWHTRMLGGKDGPRRTN